MDYKTFHSEQKPENLISIYTDGSCAWKTREGGIGIYIEESKTSETFEYFEGFSNTSIGRMELTGILLSLKILKNPKPTEHFILYCDSQYAINCMNNWIDSWSDFQFVGKKNEDILAELKQVKEQFKNIKYVWCKGHNNNFGNEMADKLANKGYKKIDKIFDNGIDSIIKYNP